MCVGCLLVMGGLGASAQAEKKVRVPQGVPDPMEEVFAVASAIQYVQAVGVQNIEIAVDQMGQQVAQYVNQVEIDQALAAQRARQPAPTSYSPPVPSSGGGGSCYDGPIPAYIVTRESGGSPTAMNPSGAYGCFQIMPYVWSANCADLDRGVAGQIECANRISNGGTNLQPWALTR
jgi:hypothetical protein